jgi:hypothetical protein
VGVLSLLRGWHGPLCASKTDVGTVSVLERRITSVQELIVVNRPSWQSTSESFPGSVVVRNEAVLFVFIRFEVSLFPQFLLRTQRDRLCDRCCAHDGALSTTVQHGRSA